MQISTGPSTELQDILIRYWGIRELRPLQLPAIKSVLDGRDSLVVMPTGGGKSLCYQAPAIMQGGTTIVVSPLISLMKDQVDGLLSQGVRAIQLDSSQSPAERTAILRDLYAGKINLLFVSPERLAQNEFCQSLRDLELRSFAIDEAHCISHWGHDFRPEYRQLEKLKEMFPKVSVHAYTATATERVRRDICNQLNLENPEILVGNFDRPNLTYRLHSRRDSLKQILEVIDRHKNEGGIIYCIRRSDVDELTVKLKKHGVKVAAYHAGMNSEARAKTQEAFAEEKCDVVVATVAFGMGIDRSNVRYVLHTGMPKSIESYQQETGRAGRDGLEAECVLLHSGADFITWKSIIEKASNDENFDKEAMESGLGQLKEMDRFCRSAGCRHEMLVNYFGQELLSESCLACDICLGETVTVADADTIAQKILSCIARIKGNFGVTYIISVLRGEKSDNATRYQHDQLSTYGLMKEHSQHDLRDWIYQLIGLGVLTQETVSGYGGMSFPILKLNEKSWELMRKERSVKLMQPTQKKKGEKSKASKSEAGSWEGVDRDLFERCRQLRKEMAEERRVPPYVIFSDATLRELSKKKPRTLVEMRQIYGIGDAKLKDLGQHFLDLINS
ncbi:MAG: DNA helicase RecQ [Candidatus Obscuribacterales bacterium]|nr:DNA helicase RecQ [Candidatus Obscuribacterales bacterium]